MIPQIPVIQPNPMPYVIAQKALEDLPYAERRRLMRMHKNGFNSAPVVQNNLQNIAEDTEQKVLEFSARTLENIRRLTVDSSRLANGYLDGVKMQIETLMEGIKDLKKVEKDLKDVIEESKPIVELRNAKIRELTAILAAYNRELTSINARQTMNLNIVNGLGNRITSHVVGAYNPPASSKYGGAEIGPHF